MNLEISLKEPWNILETPVIKSVKWRSGGDIVGGVEVIWQEEWRWSCVSSPILERLAPLKITKQFEILLSERHFQNYTSFNWTSFTVMHWTTKDAWVILTLKIEYKIARTWCTLFWVTPYIFENSLHTKSQPPTLLRSGLNLFWQTKLTITQSHILRQHAAA